MLGPSSHWRIAGAAGAVAFVFSCCAGPVLAHEIRVGDLAIIHPEIDAPAPGMDHSCAHMAIVNHGGKPVHLTGVEVEAAARTDIFQITGPDSALSKRESVEIAPGERFTFGRGEWCLLLTGISVTLEPDSALVNGALMFQELGRIPIDFMVDAAK